MKHNFKIKRIDTPNESDCWAIALSQALNIDYNIIYKQFKHMLASDGSVESDIVKGYLKKEGYTIVTSSLSLIDAIRVYDRINGILFALESINGNYHIVYIEDNIIHDGKELNDDMLWWFIKEYEVIWIAKKLNNFE
jgi:hypothetical protein